MKILVSSRSEAPLRAIQAQISRCGYESECVLLVNGHNDPLSAVDYRPDVVVLHSGSYIVRELQALAARPARHRPPIVVVGDHLPSDAMKHALRAGVRDFIGEPDSEELREALRRLEAEMVPDEQEPDSQVIVVVNAKGGCGATFIATSLAQLSAGLGGHDTVILDLDFQYGSLPHYLDLVPKRGLLEALAHAHELDEMAVQAYTSVHSSGARVMAPLPDQQSAVDFNLADRMSALLKVLQRRYRKVIIDLPRHVDDPGARVLHAADDILLVLQQSLLSVHDAVRLKTLLIRELGIAEERITCIVNRYSKNGHLDVGDIRRALDDEDLVLIPNHYRQVNQALDMGLSVIDQAPNSVVSKALVGLQGRVMGGNVAESGGFLAKTVFRLRG